MLEPIRKISQKEKVLKDLKKGKSIDTWNAFTKYRITRLSDVIFRLRREGYRIGSYYHTKTNKKTGEHKTWVEYKMEL